MVENPGWTWTYNDRSELIGAKPRNPKFATYGFSYDGVGNRTASAERTAAILTSLDYKTNALNQYTAITDDSGALPQRTFVYDRDGNLLADDRAKYHWDSQNRLIGVETRDGVVASYSYDHIGRRIRKQVCDANGTETEIQFIYNGWNLLAEIPIKPGPLLETPRFYTWGRDLSGTLQGAGGVGGLLAVREKSAPGDASFQGTFPISDGNGNITEMVNTIDTIIVHYEYGPFGQQTVLSGTDAPAQSHRFSSKYFDLETQLSNFGLRYYACNFARWMSRDPIGEQGGINLYLFGANRAPSAIDLLEAKVVDVPQYHSATKTSDHQVYVLAYQADNAIDGTIFSEWAQSTEGRIKDRSVTRFGTDVSGYRKKCDFIVHVDVAEHQDWRSIKNLQNIAYLGSFGHGGTTRNGSRIWYNRAGSQSNLTSLVYSPDGDIGAISGSSYHSLGSLSGVPFESNGAADLFHCGSAAIARELENIWNVPVYAPGGGLGSNDLGAWLYENFGIQGRTPQPDNHPDNRFCPPRYSNVQKFSHQIVGRVRNWVVLSPLAS